MLGQSFTLKEPSKLSVKIISLLICFSSLMLKTMYEAYLSSFMTEMPLQPIIASYEDMHRQGLQIMSHRVEYYDVLNEEIRRQHAKSFFLVDDNDYYVKQRNSLNSSFIYPAAKTQFDVYKLVQAHLERRLFYLNTEMCISISANFYFASRENLPYTEMWNQHMLRLKQCGFNNVWWREGVSDMMAQNLVPKQDLNKKKAQPQLQEIYFYIFSYYAILMLGSCVIFALELLIFRLTAGTGLQHSL